MTKFWNGRMRTLVNPIFVTIYHVKSQPFNKKLWDMKINTKVCNNLGKNQPEKYISEQDQILELMNKNFKSAVYVYLKN